jgi:hypothetical protein
VRLGIIGAPIAGVVLVLLGANVTMVEASLFTAVVAETPERLRARVSKLGHRHKAVLDKVLDIDLGDRS